MKVVILKHGNYLMSKYYESVLHSLTLELIFKIFKLSSMELHELNNEHASLLDEQSFEVIYIKAQDTLFGGAHISTT